jgi:hypothetical protein
MSLSVAISNLLPKRVDEPIALVPPKLLDEPLTPAAVEVVAARGIKFEEAWDAPPAGGKRIAGRALLGDFRELLGGTGVMKLNFGSSTACTDSFV